MRPPPPGVHPPGMAPEGKDGAKPAQKEKPSDVSPKVTIKDVPNGNSSNTNTTKIAAGFSVTIKDSNKSPVKASEEKPTETKSTEAKPVEAPGAGKEDKPPHPSLFNLPKPEQLMQNGDMGRGRGGPRMMRGGQRMPPPLMAGPEGMPPRMPPRGMPRGMRGPRGPGGPLPRPEMMRGMGPRPGGPPMIRVQVDGDGMMPDAGGDRVVKFEGMRGMRPRGGPMMRGRGGPPRGGPPRGRGMMRGHPRGMR